MCVGKYVGSKPFAEVSSAQVIKLTAKVSLNTWGTLLGFWRFKGETFPSLVAKNAKYFIYIQCHSLIGLFLLLLSFLLFICLDPLADV